LNVSLKDSLEIYIDGASRGNPGESAIGILIRRGKRVIKKISQSIGHATNNKAEYMALIYALQEALILKADRVRVYTDSALLYHQIQGNYKIKNPVLKNLFVQLRHLAEGFEGLEIKHIPREENKEADRLASQAISKEQAKMVAPAVPTLRRDKTAGEESPSSRGSCIPVMRDPPPSATHFGGRNSGGGFPPQIVADPALRHDSWRRREEPQ